MKILHTSDIHLLEYNDHRWDALKNLLQIGKKENIDIFVISGDLFEKNINAENLKPKIRKLFSNNGFKIFILPGNHDKEAYDENNYFGEDVVVIRNLEAPIEYKNLMIWGFPFEPIVQDKILSKLYRLSKKIPKNKNHILLFHGELLDAFFYRKDFGEEGEERYMPVKLSYFKELNFQYILAGHFHTRFEVWKLENGGYFVYPGSPVSITKKEIGKRKINLFKVGEAPKEYILDTFHFEEITIELDPFIEKHPLELIKEQLEKIHPNASLILTIKGYIDSEKLKLKEEELINKIKGFIKNKNVEVSYEFKDIHKILSDELFISFLDKLNEKNYNEDKKKILSELLIKAMIRLKT